MTPILSGDNYSGTKKNKVQNFLALFSFALLPIALMLSILSISAVHYPSHIFDIDSPLDMNTAEAISMAYATTGEEAKNAPPDSNTTANAPNSFVRNYKNPDFGFNVQYPTTWSAFELNSKFRDNVTYAAALLRAPLDNVSDKYTERININVQKLKSNNVTLDTYTSAILDAYKNITGVKIIGSSPTTLAGQPAHKVVYTDDRIQGQKLMKEQVWSLINNSKAYVITFSSEAPKYASYQPIVEDVLKSMKITASTDNPEEQKELTFDDPVFGIKLEYPSNWTKIQIGQQPRSNVDLAASFFHRENQNASLSRIGIATQQVPQNANLGQYTSNQIDAIKNANATGIQDDEDRIAGNPAHNAVFNLNNTKVMQKWTIKDGKAYIFAYQASPDEYSKNLPTFEKIADSVALTK